MRRGCKRSTLVAFLAFLSWVGGMTLAVSPSDNPIVISKFILSLIWLGMFVGVYRVIL